MNAVFNMNKKVEMNLIWNDLIFLSAVNRCIFWNMEKVQNPLHSKNNILIF